MHNEQGLQIDLYNPRKCSITNRLITAKDHASVQIIVGEVDEKGIYTGKTIQYELSGFVRRSGEADDSLNHLATKHGFLKNVWSSQR
ncbi:hypothetical protein Glove_26g238 [Diversispora epigaea]|uniref:40S ribosomal protein S21 n=1 Tax=Diversispora epigaea TaxID=1348612 RepID=A0A397JME2_9GLOM|nr:hypothetical protein Glove_26g238 [Diversispora epigaea]